MPLLLLCAKLFRLETLIALFNVLQFYTQQSVHPRYLSRKRIRPVKGKGPSSSSPPRSLLALQPISY